MRKDIGSDERRASRQRIWTKIVLKRLL